MADETTAMEPKVEIIVAPAACGKTERILKRYRAAVAERGEPGEAGGVLLLLPTALAVDQAKARLFAAGGIEAVFAPNVCSFYDFVNPIIEHNSKASREVGRAQQHAVLHRIVAALRRDGALPALAPSTSFAGFVDSLIRLFEVLKEATVRPEQLLENCPDPGTRQHEIARIYERYQQYLTANDLYDPQGKLWRAGRLIDKGLREPFQDVREMLIDGFADFTTAEFDIIRAMAAHCERITFTLTCETDSRPDLFGNTRDTLALIRRFFKNAEVVRLEAPEDSPRRALDQSRLFAGPKSASGGPRPAPGRVEILGLPSRADEIAEVGRRIKRMIVEDGRSPADIAVIYRAQGDYDALIADIFTEQGLPFYLDAMRPIATLPEMRALLRLVELPLADFSFAAVCRFLKALRGAPLFAGLDDPAATLEFCARQAGVVRGRETWLPRLKAWRARLENGNGEDAPDRRDELPAKLVVAKRGIEIAGRFFEEIANLQTDKTAADFAAEINRLAGVFGLDRGPLYETVRRELDKIADLPPLAGAAHATMTYAAFAEHFRAVRDCREKWTEGDRSCRVVVTDALKARNVVFPVVFLVGLAEREFPRPILQNAFIGDAERREMKRTGGPSLPESADEQGKEMPLFYNAVTRAAETLVLTYPALDHAGNEIHRSWYLDEIVRAFDNVAENVVLEPPPAPPLAQAVTPREAAAAFVNEARHKPAPPPTLDTADLAERIAVEAERDSFDTFGRFDGVLDDPAAAKLLAEALERIVFSTSRMNAFLTCPFNYFCARVLRLEESQDPEPGVTPIERGHWYHEVLRRFYIERAAEGSAEVTEDNVAEALERMAEICAEHRRALEESGLPRHERMFGMEHRRMTEKLAAFLKAETDKSKFVPGEPTYCEFGFGFGETKPDADPASVERTFDLDCDGRVARFRGYIDRIDVDEANNVVTVKDYKSGRAPAPGLVARGIDIQLPLYVMAVRALLYPGEEKDYRAQYIESAHADASTALESGGNQYHNLDDILQKARDAIKRALDEIAAGRFPPTPAKICPDYCPAKKACKFNKRRIEKKSE